MGGTTRETAIIHHSQCSRTILHQRLAQTHGKKTWARSPSDWNANLKMSERLSYKSLELRTIVTLDCTWMPAMNPTPTPRPLTPYFVRSETISRSICPTMCSALSGTKFCPCPRRYLYHFIGHPALPVSYECCAIYRNVITACRGPHLRWTGAFFATVGPFRKALASNHRLLVPRPTLRFLEAPAKVQLNTLRRDQGRLWNVRGAIGNDSETYWAIEHRLALIPTFLNMALQCARV
jgi:hypothetical protein